MKKVILYLIFIIIQMIACLILDYLQIHKHFYFVVGVIWLALFLSVEKWIGINKEAL